MSCPHGWMLGSALAIRPPCPACAFEDLRTAKARIESLKRELAEAKAALASIHEAVGIDGREGEPIHLAVHRICGQWNQRGVELTRSEARCAELEKELGRG